MNDLLLLTEPQAAKRLSISTKTLSRMRQRGEVAFLQIGRAIRYDVGAIRSWIASAEKRVAPTA